MPAFESFVAQKHILEKYSNLPRGHYVSLFLIRKTESETIFRTEGSGEGLVKETVSAGLVNTAPIRRVVISKRKQTAVERRTGRDFLREHGLLLRNKSGKDNKEGPECMLNTNQPCERCVDCFLYGFAAGGGGAQKSRVLTDDSFSIAPVSLVTDKRTFNATYDDGTMRNPVDKSVASRSINEDEYVRPQTHFLDIETLKDVTLPEMQYVVGNILRSSRYGAISSRMGKITNKIVALAFSDCELFSNLELTQKVYDLLLAKHPDKDELPFPLADKDLEPLVLQAIEDLSANVFSSKPLFLTGTALEEELRGVAALYPDKLTAALKALTESYPGNSK